MKNMKMKLATLFLNLFSKEHDALVLEAQKRGYEKGYNHATHDVSTETRRQVYEEHASQNWVINQEQVLSVPENGRIYLNGQQISDLEVKSLQAEVKALKNFRIWDIFQETIRQKAIEKSVLGSDATVVRDVNPELMAGKMMLHNLGILRSIVEVIDKYKL